MSEESKRVKYLLQYWSHLQLAREYEKLENIIKEAREYIDKYLEREYFDTDILESNTIYNRDLYKVLKILQGSDEE